MARSIDAVIIGAGPAGIAAAVAAARKGCRTLLVDSATQPGGTVLIARISTVCGLYLNQTGTGPEFRTSNVSVYVPPLKLCRNRWISFCAEPAAPACVSVIVNTGSGGVM